MEKTEFYDKILEDLNNFLFDAFVEMSLIYEEDKDSYKSLLQSLLVLDDIKKPISQTADSMKDEAISMTDEDIKIINNFNDILTNISCLVRGKKEDTNKLSIFAKYKLTDQDAKTIADLTKLGINAAFYSLS